MSGLPSSAHAQRAFSVPSQLAVLGGIFCAAAVFASPTPTPQDYTYAVEITAPGQAAFYRFDLPDAVYTGVSRGDLADMAVFNARGEAVAFALRQPPPGRTSPPAQSVPLFPLPDESATADALPLQVEVSAGGRVVKLLGPGTNSRAAAPNAYLADLTSFQGPLASIEIEWKAGTAALAAAMDVESSDDLRNWRTLAHNAPLLQLAAAGAELRLARIEVAPSAAKYLRLRYAGTGQRAEISALRLQAAPNAEAPQRRWKTLSGSSPEKARYEFDPQGYYPVDRLRIYPASQNVVVPVSVLSRAQTDKTWRLIAHTVAYRLQRESEEIYAPEVAVDVQPGRRYALHADGSDFGAAPNLAIGWIAQEVVFAAHGPGPYRLSYGSARAAAAALPIATLIPGYDGRGAPGLAIARAGTGIPAASGATKVLTAPPPLRTWALWVSLAVAVAVLALMAWRIASRLPRRDADSH
ncbi:MAG: DUF3999 domain-containing protein [Rhodocyclaceae bacterium]|nr:DUF3999 domain-containing protein [Rhodocyclaceae bacterium]